MSINKYFKSEQKILLRPQGDDTPGTIETLSAYYLSGGEGYCDLVLPYRTNPDENYPFDSDTRIELLGDAMGVGIRGSGRFERQLNDKTIRIRLEPDLEMFQRRLHRRYDATIGVRYTRGVGTLRSFRQQWQKNIQLLQGPVDIAKLGTFPRFPVNLGAGGLRLGIKPPIEIAGLCLVLLQLEPGSLPICALAEIVWSGNDDQSDGLFPAGMQFVNILAEDQKRIEQYITAGLRTK